MPRGRPRKFIGPLTQKAQQKKDHKKVVRLTKLVTQPKLKNTSSFPPQMRVKQKYFEYFASNGTTDGRVFNINSTFDPDRSGVGHQPNGRDNMAAIYNKYRVHGATIKVQFAATSATAYIGMVAVCNNTGSLSTFYILNEQPGTKRKTSGFNGAAFQINHKSDCAKTAGVSKMQYESNDIYQALCTADPAEIMTFQVMMYKVDGTTLAAGAVYAEIVIEYDVTYFDGNSIGLS